MLNIPSDSTDKLTQDIFNQEVAINVAAMKDEILVLKALLKEAVTLNPTDYTAFATYLKQGLK